MWRGNVATYTSLTQYRKALRKKIRLIEKNGVKSSGEAAKLIVTRAKAKAPRHSGQTLKGIRRRKVKGGYSVESWVPGRFKQNMFADQRAPFGLLNFRSRGGVSLKGGILKRYYAPNQTVIYGGPAKSHSGNQIRWTGTPRFFTRAVLETRKDFGKITDKNTKKALRARL